MDNKSVGDFSEISVLRDLSKHGKVSVPFGEYRYDLIYDDGRRLYKVQVKTSTRSGQHDDRHTVRLKRTRGTGEPYDKADFDILAIYTPDLNDIAYYPWKEETIVQGLTVRFREDMEDVRPSIRSRVNVASEMTLTSATESLK